MNEEKSPVQDAVVAFCVLVRAVADGNRTRQREQVENLRRCGFDVRVRRDALENRKAVPTR